MPLPALSHLSSQQTTNSPPFWEENTEQRAEQINLPRTHSSEQEFEPQMPLCSHSRDWSRFFLKLCFSISHREWIINYSRALCTSQVPGLQGSISVGGREWGCHHVGNYSRGSSAKREWRSSLGTERGRALIQNENQAPRGPVWNLYWQSPCKVFGLGVLLLL